MTTILRHNESPMPGSSLTVMAILCAALVTPSASLAGQPKNYRVCIEQGSLPEECDKIFDRIEWMPTPTTCLVTYRILKAADDLGQELSWKLLYQNEKCKADALKYYSRDDRMLPGAEASAAEGFTTYHDQQFPFSLRYPSAWAQVPPDHAQVRFKAVSRGGAGMDQCNVVVTTDPSFTNISAAEFVDALIASGNVAAESERHLANFSMIDVWKGSVSGQSALYYVATHTYTVLDIPITLEGLVASTLVGENMYQITCQSPATNFDQVMPSFNRFMSEFVVQH